MRRRLLVAYFLLIALPAFAAWKFNPHTSKLDYYERGTDNVCVQDNQVSLWDNTLQRFVCGGISGVGGPAGPKGDNGATGATGATGPQGPAGDNGATGPQGIQGVQGPAGDNGAVGPQGPSGPSVTTLPWDNITSRPTINSVTVAGAVLDNVSNYPAGLLRTDGSAASLTSFPTLNQNTTGTASNVSGTPALPNGTTATTQAAHDNGTKLATTRYVDGRDKFWGLNIDQPALTDNVIFAGPLFTSVTIDNIVFIVQDNTGKLSGASTDNVTVNVCYSDNVSSTSWTKVVTSDVVVTGAAVNFPAINSGALPVNAYVRVIVAATNMTNKKLYVRVRYRE